MTEKSQQQKDIEEAIKRGVVSPSKANLREREPQQYETHSESYLDRPVARDTTIPKKIYPFNWYGDMEFKKVLRYESEQGSFLIRRVKKDGSLMITSLVKDQPVRGHIVIDEFGEPKYLLLNPSGSSSTTILWTVKLHGEVLTNKQKTVLKKEMRSTKIAKQQLEIEALKNEIEASKNDLKAAEETIGDLKTENKELTKTMNLSIHDKLKKLLLHKDPE